MVSLGPGQRTTRIVHLIESDKHVVEINICLSKIWVLRINLSVSTSSKFCTIDKNIKFNSDRLRRYFFVDTLEFIPGQTNERRAANKHGTCDKWQIKKKKW